MEAKGIKLDKELFYIIGNDWEQIVANIYLTAHLLPGSILSVLVQFNTHRNPSLALQLQQTILPSILHIRKLRQNVATKKSAQGHWQDGCSQG